MPPCPDRAPLSCRPLPPGRAAGPGSPGSRGRRSRQRRPVGGRAPRPLLRSLQLLALRGQGAHKRKGRAARIAPASPLDPLCGGRQSIRAPQSSGCRGGSPQGRKFQGTPLGAAWAAKSPSGRCPRPHNFETLGQGTGTGRESPKKEEMKIWRLFISAKCTLRVARRSFGLARAPRASSRPGAAPGRPRALPRPPLGRGRAPASTPPSSGRAQHSPRPGCAPRGPAPSPINGML